MKFPILSFGLAVFLLAGVIVGPVRGASKDDEKSKRDDSVFELNKKEPIYITSDWMEVDQKKNTITYKGRVVTIQSEMTMRSETLTAVYDPEMKQIKQIIAEGKVNAVQGNRMATGDKAIFDEKAKTVTLTGNPVMRQGNSQITGSRIIYYIDQDRAVAEGKDSFRVQVTIFPEELQKKDNDNSEAGSSTAK
jgi:lipopolysaccharide export system protein LptA